VQVVPLTICLKGTAETLFDLKLCLGQTLALYLWCAFKNDLYDPGVSMTGALVYGYGW